MKGTSLRLFLATIVIVFTVCTIMADDFCRAPVTDEISKKMEVEESGTENVENEAVIETERIMPSVKTKPDSLLHRFKAEEEQIKEKSTYSLMTDDIDHNIFINKVDGYTVRIPRTMRVDMEFSEIRAVLENQELRIEIYRQKLDQGKGLGIESYINYSNRFIENQIDHKNELQETIQEGDLSIQLLQWSRKPLARIAEDKCYYASVEMPLDDKKEVITFLFKNSRPFENKNYLEIVSSLKLIPVTEQPYTRAIKHVENKSWNEETAKVYQHYFGQNSKLHWGIFETNAPLDFNELKKIEGKLEFTFPVLLYYTGILEGKEMHPNLSKALENAKRERRLLELTLQSVEQMPGEGNMVYDVLDGKYDRYLKNYAGAVAASGEPILFRLGNEMNGDWCVYSSHHTSKDTEIYKAFYRYVYSIFEKAGADNVIWVWNPNGKSFPDFKWNDELCYYPGDEYVDVIGMTSYNTGTYYQSENWTEFDQMYDALYNKYTKRYDKPLMITEFSSSSVGGSKDAWVENMFRHIDKYDRIKVAIWWDGCDWDAEGNVARSYFIDETEELVRVFRENLARYR